MCLWHACCFCCCSNLVTSPVKTLVLPTSSQFSRGSNSIAQVGFSLLVILRVVEYDRKTMSYVCYYTIALLCTLQSTLLRLGPRSNYVGKKFPPPLLIHFTIKIFTIILGIYMNIYLCEYLTLPICASAYSECSFVCVWASFMFVRYDDSSQQQTIILVSKYNVN